MAGLNLESRNKLILPTTIYPFPSDMRRTVRSGIISRLRDSSSARLTVVSTNERGRETVTVYRSNRRIGIDESNPKLLLHISIESISKRSPVSTTWHILKLYQIETKDTYSHAETALAGGVDVLIFSDFRII